MNMKLTKKEALIQFNEEINISPPRIRAWRKDKIAMQQAWSNYTDMLCKGSDITESQYKNWSNPFS
jgi:hypothetical protein